MKTRLIVPAVLLFSASLQAAEVSSTTGFTSDYRFRGISQSAGDAAIQGSIDVGYDNGIYAGVWGSNVDFGDDAHLEIDWYVGYGADINDDLSWDATLYYYTYPGYEDVDGDYAELDLNLYYGDFSLEYAHSNDYFNSSETGQYLALNYSLGVTEEISVDLHAGHSFGNYWTELDIGNYNDYSIGVSTSAAGLDLSAVYLFNSIDDGMETNGNNPFATDNSLVVTVSRSF